MAVSAGGAVRGDVRLPSSKSLTNRALAIAALASGRSEIKGPLLSDDTVRMARALRALGVPIEPFGDDADEIVHAMEGDTPRRQPGPQSGLRIDGGPGGRQDASPAGHAVMRPASRALDVGGSGTAMRFLTAIAALAPGEVVLDGDRRMRERPMGPLLEALRDWGADAASIRGNGCPPVRVQGPTLTGGIANLRGDVSSQFVSALLIVAPLANGRTSLRVLPPVVSRPYIDLTIDVMGRFGVLLARGEIVPEAEGSLRGHASVGTLITRPGGAIEVTLPGGGSYAPTSYSVPPDASSASYVLAAAAIAGGSVTIVGLSARDRSGDLRLLDHLGDMGCRFEGGRRSGHDLPRSVTPQKEELAAPSSETIDEHAPVTSGDLEGLTIHGPPGAGGRIGALHAFDLDLSSTPDLVPTMAVLALFANGPSEIRNVPHLRHKESDRLHALACELRRLGAVAVEREDGLRIVPGPLHGATIETYHDHRMAMAFALAGLVIPGVVIKNPGCVGKSFPDFWTVLAGLRAS